uniref:Uncharacterized protein n=1 Tax=Sphaerodactylus townsendi TaxID=933632 RepID=A0ACB8F750_9SAUR
MLWPPGSSSAGPQREEDIPPHIQAGRFVSQDPFQLEVAGLGVGRDDARMLRTLEATSTGPTWLSKARVDGQPPSGSSKSEIAALSATRWIFKE